MILTVINNKGGTGKTTTCVNLAAALAMLGNEVLLVDLDSQASASVSLGMKNDGSACTIGSVLFEDVSIAEAARETGIKRLTMICGGMDVANGDLILAGVAGRERLLQSRLAPIESHFDYILLDSPPALSMIFINAMVAADGFIVPLTPEYLSYEGFENLMKVAMDIRKNMNAHAELLGILLTMVTPLYRINRKLYREIVNMMKREYKEYLFLTQVARSVMLSEAPASGKTIFDYAPRSTGARHYMALAEEVIGRCSILGRNAEDAALAQGRT